MVRETAVSGHFYGNSFEELSRQIEECYKSEYGPGDLPVRRNNNKKLFGVVVPHAGYVYSGACAAWAYKEIAESSFPKTFVLLGPNHFGLGSGLSIEDWKTPFGIVKTDKDLVREIKEKTELEIKEQHHITEHSIEVQMPFLQFSNKDRVHDIRVVPIALSNDVDFQTLGKDLSSIFKKKDVGIIVSSDFTHYGPNYGYVPFSSDIPERITKLDKGAIELIMSYDVDGFKNYLNKTGITICGYIPLLVFLTMINELEEKPKAHLLMHYTSGDLTKDYKNSVSYASLAFNKI